MKKFFALLSALIVLTFSYVIPGAFARDVTDAIIGQDGLLSVPARLAGCVMGTGLKFFSAMLGGPYDRDYGDTGYRHGGYAYQYDYQSNGDGANGYGYNHQGLDGNGYSGV